MAATLENSGASAPEALRRPAPCDAPAAGAGARARRELRHARA